MKLFVTVQGRVVLLLHGFSLQHATAFLEEAGGQRPEKELPENVICVTYRRAARPLSFVHVGGCKARTGAPKKHRIRECTGASTLVDYLGLRKVF